MFSEYPGSGRESAPGVQRIAPTTRTKCTVSDDRGLRRPVCQVNGGADSRIAICLFYRVSRHSRLLAALAALKDRPGPGEIAGSRVLLPNPEIERPDIAPHHAGLIVGIQLQ